jgi:hypothetical protein
VHWRPDSKSAAGTGPDSGREGERYFDEDEDEDEDGDMREPAMIGGVPLPKTNEPPTVSMTTLRTREGMKPLS